MTNQNNDNPPNDRNMTNYKQTTSGNDTKKRCFCCSDAECAGKYPLVNVQKAIEKGPVEIVDVPIKKWWSFPSFFVNVYQAR